MNNSKKNKTLWIGHWKRELTWTSLEFWTGPDPRVDLTREHLCAAAEAEHCRPDCQSMVHRHSRQGTALLTAAELKSETFSFLLNCRLAAAMFGDSNFFTSPGLHSVSNRKDRTYGIPLMHLGLPKYTTEIIHVKWKTVTLLCVRFIQDSMC